MCFPDDRCAAVASAALRGDQEMLKEHLRF